MYFLYELTYEHKIPHIKLKGYACSKQAAIAWTKTKPDIRFFQIY